jgi:hypothetical protein
VAFLRGILLILNISFKYVVELPSISDYEIEFQHFLLRPESFLLLVLTELGPVVGVELGEGVFLRDAV